MKPNVPEWGHEKATVFNYMSRYLGLIHNLIVLGLLIVFDE